MNPSDRAAELIRTLGLVPHPERGFYVETYRSPTQVQPETHPGPRSASTAIYFLLTAEVGATHLHRLRSDELFHLYEGGPLSVLLLGPDGGGRVATLGLDLSAGQRPQMTIPAGTWFGTWLAPRVTHCLWGCTVAPGFAFEDFELAAGPELADRYPAFRTEITRLARKE